MNSDQIKVLLVDDHPVLRDGLRALLEEETDLIVVGEAANGREAIELTASLRPDVVVMDIGLPDISGIKAVEMIRNQGYGGRIVILSMHTRREYVINAVEAGCDGYLPKSATHTSLIDSIRIVHNGERYLHPIAATALMAALNEENTAEEQFLNLTKREQEVIRLAAMGYTSRDIGEKLIISPKTVETYRHRAFEKLGLQDRVDLVRFALQAGLMDELKDVEK